MNGQPDPPTTPLDLDQHWAEMRQAAEKREARKSLAARFFGGPWALAAMVALPLAELYWLYITIHDMVTGGAWLSDLFFGWLLALLFALIFAIPLGVLFMGVNAMWQATVWWWKRLPFTVKRK